ncbi:MAG: response regulator, partial [Bdellovibrionales bacterium]|nr:response regulator [Bdellovibrionales bacterium]
MQGDAFNSGLSFNANKRSKKNEFTNKTNGVKVLIVDDSTKALIPLNLIFLSLGCETILTFDGNDAIREILIHWPDLIILDWRMPKVNGGEAIARTQRTLDYDYPHLDIRRNKSISVV